MPGCSKLISGMDIVVATRNKKKVQEIARILEGLPARLLSLDDFPDCPDVEETETTFKGNALLKARAIRQCTGKAALADDSGLAVDALNGAPGIFSARFAGTGATDRQNVEKLLREMENVPEEERTARFICVIALSLPVGAGAAPTGVRTATKGSAELTFEGRVEGRIGREPAGEWGFGYDPVFYPEGHDRTFAEMSPAEKDSMSHRARALEFLRNYMISKDFFKNAPE